MPASNPRLTITLQPATAAQLRRLSELTGNSQSALIAELLEANGPTFERLILVLQAATEAKAALSADVASGMKEAQANLERQLGLTLETFDEVTKPLLEDVERIKRRTAKRGGAAALPAPASAAGAGSTPMSNRGVRSTSRTPKDHKKGR